VGSTIIRQWHLLALLPKGPRRIDTATLETHLRARGLDVHRRTIQRDLVELAAVFPIVSDERSKPYGWRWADHADALCAFPSMAAGTAEAAEIDLLLRVRAGAVQAVTERLRAASAGARDIEVSARTSDGDVCVVKARVPDGPSLRRWLFECAEFAVVVAPPHLRAEIADRANRIAAAYRDEPD
jgi:predicted DNA-binding transcriptional regulator YafY